MCLHGLLEGYFLACGDSIQAVAERATVFSIISANKNAKVRGSKETFLVAHAFYSLFDLSCTHRFLFYVRHQPNAMQCEGFCDIRSSIHIQHF